MPLHQAAKRIWKGGHLTNSPGGRSHPDRVQTQPVNQTCRHAGFEGFIQVGSIGCLDIASRGDEGIRQGHKQGVPGLAIHQGQSGLGLGCPVRHGTDPGRDIRLTQGGLLITHPVVLSQSRAGAQSGYCSDCNPDGTVARLSHPWHPSQEVNDSLNPERMNEWGSPITCPGEAPVPAH